MSKICEMPRDWQEQHGVAESCDNRKNLKLKLEQEERNIVNTISNNSDSISPIDDNSFTPEDKIQTTSWFNARIAIYIILIVIAILIIRAYLL